jgi:membrane-associated phospholipid phosphatase
MFVQRGRPAQAVPDVILRGNSAAHGLSFPSGHAMVIFAITALDDLRAATRIADSLASRSDSAICNCSA